MKIKSITQLKLKKLKRRLDYRAEQTEIRSDIRKQIGRDNKKLREEHKEWVMFLDFVIISVIIMNLGALMITNAMVMKVEEGQPQPILVEANPVVAEINNYQVDPQGKIIMNQFMIFIIFWTILTNFYIYVRKHIYNTKQLYMLTFYLMFYTFSIGTDFINDFGFYVGSLIF